MEDKGEGERKEAKEKRRQSTQDLRCLNLIGLVKNIK